LPKCGPLPDAGLDAGALAQAVEFVATPVLFLLASLISGKPVLPQAGKTDVYLAVFGILLTMPYMAGLLFRPRREFARLGPDSTAVLILYVVGVIGLVFIGR